MASPLDIELDNCLAESVYFRGLAPEHRRRLVRVCRRQSLKKRSHLFLEGEKGQAVYVLLSGAVQLVKTSEDGREVVIKTVNPGEIFAEAILFETPAYPVTAVALNDADVCAIPRTDFRALLDNKAFRDDFIAGIMTRLRYLSGRMLYLTAYDVEERFYRFLAEQYGKKEVYTLSMSNKDIASAIAATPETLSRLKERLNSERKLVWEGKSLRLPPDFWEERL